MFCTLLCLLVIFCTLLGDFPFCTIKRECEDSSYTTDNGFIECSGFKSCQGSVITCNNYCNIDCIGGDSCRQAEFYCRKGCNIQCVGSRGCNSLTFNIYNNTNNSLQCTTSISCKSRK